MLSKWASGSTSASTSASASSGALTLVAGVCTTLAAGAAIAFGLRVMIRRHNSLRSMSAFRGRRRRIASALKAIEKSSALLGPQLQALAVAISEAADKSTNGNKLDPNKPLESNKLLQHQPKLTSTSSKKLKQKSAKTTAVTTTSEKKDGGNDKAKDKLICKLREIDELLIRALESLDAIRPADMAAGLNILEHLPAPSLSSSPKSLTADLVADESDDATLVSNDTAAISANSNDRDGSPEKEFPTIGVFPTLKTSSSSSSVVSLAFTYFFVPTFFFDTDQLDKKDVAVIQASVLEWRIRKRKLVRKIQGMAADVDALFEKILAN
ncbi:hypothetical protein HK100_000708 [Physocladia obscura]|uniref:Uncharacterized protein n=1 Tax=Physocladia obscura TaxID=109957 RepID=A0AAD5XBM2_9FUNG|nr:hypothetical protein HK100_000708 [Physocladia obscura]